MSVLFLWAPQNRRKSKVMQEFDEVGTERVPHRDDVLCFAFGFSRSRHPNPVFSRTVISRSRLNHTENIDSRNHDYSPLNMGICRCRIEQRDLL